MKVHYTNRDSIQDCLDTIQGGLSTIQGDLSTIQGSVESSLDVIQGVVIDLINADMELLKFQADVAKAVVDVFAGQKIVPELSDKLEGRYNLIEMETRWRGSRDLYILQDYV